MALSLIGVEDMTTDQEVSGLNPDEVTESDDKSYQKPAKSLILLAFFILRTIKSFNFSQKIGELFGESFFFAEIDSPNRPETLILSVF